MKRVWHHYEKWEDFQNGMYNEDKEGRQERVAKAIELLTNEDLCYEYMRRVTKEWRYATEQQLTNSRANPQSFLGQTACSLYAGVHEDETREAWGRLNNEQRYVANSIADRVAKEWKEEYEEALR